MADKVEAPEGVEENKKFPVDLDKLTGDEDLREALRTALERYEETGGDTKVDLVGIVIVVTGGGASGSAEAEVDLEEFQVEEEPEEESETEEPEKVVGEDD